MVRKALPTPPNKARFSQPMKMPTPTKLPTVVNPPAKGKSRSPKSATLSPAELAIIVKGNANRTTPKLGGELPAFKTMTAAKPRKVMASPNFRSTGTPGTSKYVPRGPRVSTGMPGTKNYVQRMPGGAHQRKPSAAGVGMGRVMNTLRAKLTAPRKPAK